MSENVGDVGLAFSLFQQFSGFIGQENELKYRFSSEKACALAVLAHYRFAAFSVLSLAGAVELFYLVGGNIEFPQHFLIGLIRFSTLIAQLSYKSLIAYSHQGVDG
jgi:hypothetical protein